MYVTGKTARILKGRGKGKIGEITSCDAVGNVTIRTDDGKEYGPMPDWGNYVILGGSVLDVIRRDSALDIIRKNKSNFFQKYSLELSFFLEKYDLFNQG